MLFGLTPDLHAVFPALGARELGWVHVPMLHSARDQVLLRGEAGPKLSAAGSPSCGVERGSGIPAEPAPAHPARAIVTTHTNKRASRRMRASPSFGGGRGEPGPSARARASPADGAALASASRRVVDAAKSP
ncbi:MAG: hypothetical protein ABI231_10835 [Candidatus Tumulicola sp.]